MSIGRLHARSLARNRSGNRSIAPLIAISARPRLAGEVSGWSDLPAAVMQTSYLEAIWRAGGMEAMVAPRHMTDGEADALVSRVDGLVLVGGSDIDPAHYGQASEPEVYGVDPGSDALELALVRAAWRIGLPTLAICRGMQVLNVARGGTLHQHITGKFGWDEHGRPGVGVAMHRVTVEPGSAIAKTQGGRSEISRCWSYHHQAIDTLGDGLVATAWADDGSIEGIERSDGFGWLVAPQWHPERTAANDPAQQALFDALVGEAADR